MDTNCYCHRITGDRVFRIIETKGTKIRSTKGNHSVSQPEYSVLGVIQSGDKQISQLCTAILRKSCNRHTRNNGRGADFTVESVENFVNEQ